MTPTPPTPLSISAVNPERPYLTCREVLDFIMAYLDGELDKEQRFEFERHLTVCRSCVNYLDTYKKTVSLGKAALKDTDEPAGASVPDGLLRAIQAARKKSS